MSKRVYISADYDPDSGDRNVVNELYKWSASQRHSIAECIWKILYPEF